MIDEFRLLPCLQYAVCRTLKDTVVAIHFTLKHREFNSSDANIVNMCDLVPPKHPLTPRRRKFALTNPFDST